MIPPRTLDDTLDALHATLRQLQRWGLAGFDCSPRSLDTLARWSEADDPSASAGKPVGGAPVESLEDIRAHLGDCRRCSLAGGRTCLVFGEGSPAADLVFVGEGPGLEEDRSGKPFVGPAGQLLTRIIRAMSLERDQVYICNVIKCRPPENRDPLPEEIATCRPFLDRQLAAIRPKAICALGAHATRTLLDTTAGMSRLRGRFHDYKGIKVMPTYHPAYLLRNPDQKRAVWEDIKKLMAFLRLPH